MTARLRRRRLRRLRAEYALVKASNDVVFWAIFDGLTGSGKPRLRHAYDAFKALHREQWSLEKSLHRRICELEALLPPERVPRPVPA